MWIVWVAAGYAACVLLPCPLLSRAILDGWAKLAGAVKAKIAPGGA